MVLRDKPDGRLKMTFWQMPCEGFFGHLCVALRHGVLRFMRSDFDGMPTARYMAALVYEKQQYLNIYLRCVSNQGLRDMAQKSNLQRPTV